MKTPPTEVDIECPNCAETVTVDITEQDDLREVIEDVAQDAYSEGSEVGRLTS